MPAIRGMRDEVAAKGIRIPLSFDGGAGVHPYLGALSDKLLLCYLFGAFD